MDVHIRRLRAKLGEEHAHLIQTVRSVGYRFGQAGWHPGVTQRNGATASAAGMTGGQPGHDAPAASGGQSASAASTPKAAQSSQTTGA